MKEEIYNILSKIYREADEPFSGLGILIYNDFEKLPVSPLYNDDFTFLTEGLYDNLKELSSYKSTHHDGFHLISSNLEITHVSQYFYPAPINGVTLDSSMGYGTRYFVAKTGSVLPNIIFSGVVGNRNGVQLFEDGSEIDVTLND